MANKREREIARMRAERQAARRAAAAQERQKNRNALYAGLAALAVAAVVVLIALATDDGKPSQLAQANAVCTYSSAGKASKKVDGLPPAEGPSTTGTVDVTLKTGRGDIGLALDSAKAPCTVNSFTFLASQKYFDGTTCHRLTSQGIYVLQCGDPSATGSGGPGYQFKDENLAAFGKAGKTGSVVYPRGTVAMANAGPGTNGSQFFLVYKDSPLPPNYTPFGTIAKGLDLLDTVAQAGSDPAGDGKPKLEVKLEKVTVAD